MMMARVVLCILSILATSSVLAEELYVDPNGNDSNLGTIEYPLATLTEAKKRVRTTKKNAKGPLTVYLRAGTYYLPETITFSPVDSGTVDSPVTYTAYNNEKVIISGGVKLNGPWTKNPDDTLSLKVDLRPDELDQLFVNGERQILARWPNQKLDDRGVDVGYSTGIQPVNTPIRKFAYDPAKFSPRQWNHQHNAIIHIFHTMHWGNLQWLINDIDYDKHTIALGIGGWQIGTLWYGKRSNDVGSNSKFYIENVLEELNAPGEWYYDRKATLLYYIPEKNFDQASTDFVAAGRLKELFVFEGIYKGGEPMEIVKHIHLSNLILMHTARIFLEPHETRLRGDWAIARLGAVRFDGASDCTVSGCLFDGVGGNGVFISNHVRRIDVLGCHFREIGESAVCLVGNDDAVRNLGIHKVRYASHEGIDTKPGPRSTNYPANCKIHNNLMHELGVFGKQTAGIFISASENIKVSYNTIYHTPRAGICINDGCWGGHIIEFNDVFQTVRETGDHGPFNSWGRDRYWQSHHRENLPCDLSRSKEFCRLDNRTPTIIQNNRFVHEGKGHSWGIDLDDGSTNYIVRNNLCLGCSIKLREGFYRTIENNVFVSAIPPAKQCCFRDSGDVIRHNIIVDISGNRGWVDLCDPLAQMDRTLYYNLNDKTPVFRCRADIMGTGFKNLMNLAEWQAQGFDRNSVYADPKFVAPEKGDFSVRVDSPALELGFENFPMDRFGTQKKCYKKIVVNVRRKYRLVDNHLQ